LSAIVAIPSIFLLSLLSLLDALDILSLSLLLSDVWLGSICLLFIFLNNISDFFIFVIFKGESISSREILKLKVFAIFSQVSGINGERRIAITLIAFANS